MPDHIFLSVWFANQTAQQMAPRLCKAMSLFPASKLKPGVQSVAVVPLDWSEPRVVDEQLEADEDPQSVLELLREYEHDDYAMEAEMSWDLWQAAHGEWHEEVSPVRFTVFGSEFAEQMYREQGHLLLDLGFDVNFLGQQKSPQCRSPLARNIAKLLHYYGALQEQMHPVRRRLWLESGGDLGSALLQWVQ